MLIVNYLLEVKKYRLQIQRPLWDSNPTLPKEFIARRTVEMTFQLV